MAAVVAVMWWQWQAAVVAVAEAAVVAVAEAAVVHHLALACACVDPEWAAHHGNRRHHQLE